MAIDPYRVLGLSTGASPAEVKRAYRRLAKANHPDSAGVAALPRFLEIQRAYETLAAGTWRPGTRRPTSGAASEPWRADPGRTRSTPGAQSPGSSGGRSGSRRGAGTDGGPGTRSDGSSGRSGGGGARSGGNGGTTSGEGGARSGGGPRTRSRTGQGAGSARSGSGTGSARPGPGTDGPRGRGTTGRRRPSRTATFGSTTYDEARDQPDTSWSGASWYGPSSGEYWRVNPREYADPRKHGPEYQARAAARAAAAAERRTAGGAAGAASAESAAGDREPADAGRPMDRGDAAHATAGRRRGRSAGSAGAAASRRGFADRAGPPPGRTWQDRPDDQPGGLPESSSGAGAIAWPGRVVAHSPLARRSLRALIAWPPLGIAAAAVIGEATGCASFEATCTAPADLYPWLAQAAILLALLALPGIARAFAGGTVAVVLLAFPVAAALSASGAGYDRTYGPAALIAVLAIVWALGVGAVLLRRAVTRGLP